MGTRLYVGNLSFNSSESDLAGLFSQIGKVVNCNLISDKFTGKSRGFAFVEMSSQDEANKAIEQLNGTDFQGRALTVNEARRKPEGGLGGGGGFGGNRGGGGGNNRREPRW